ncbi:MAG TPA: hypothetical protein VNH15_00620 [Elusimicrobiota bacterium]|nr:hypothetical protein [Elusimicrobiota bacterium]
MILTAVLLGAALALPARAQSPSALRSLELEAGVGAGSLHFAPLHIPVNGMMNPALTRPMYTVALPAILDADRRTSAMFMAGSVPVHVFGTKSENKKSWFIEFWPENAAQPIFVKGSKLPSIKVLGLSLFNGALTMEFNHISYRVYINLCVSDMMRSRLVVKPADGRGQAATFLIADLVRDAYQTGVPLNIGGKAYRLVYSRNFIESNDSFERYSGDNLLVFMTFNGNKVGGFHVIEQDIPRTGAGMLISTPSKERRNSSDSPDQTTVGLSRDAAGNLKIYYPVSPALASY